MKVVNINLDWTDDLNGEAICTVVDEDGKHHEAVFNENGLIKVNG